MHVQSFRLERSGMEKSQPVKLKMNIINSDAGDFSTPASPSLEMTKTKNM